MTSLRKKYILEIQAVLCTLQIIWSISCRNLQQLVFFVSCHLNKNEYICVHATLQERNCGGGTYNVYAAYLTMHFM